MALTQSVEDGLRDLGLTTHVNKAEPLAHYLEMIQRWNKVTNLTAVKNPVDMVAMHLLDSLSIHRFIVGSRILDVGSGAGLPGIPLALLLPDKDFILLDSNGKKTRFMTQAVIELELNNVTVRHMRIESCTETFDQIVSRAFASLEGFVQLCLPRLNQKGSLLAMKGPLEADQAEGIPGASVQRLDVPGLDKERYLITVPKSPGVNL